MFCVAATEASVSAPHKRSQAAIVGSEVWSRVSVASAGLPPPPDPPQHNPASRPASRPRQPTSLLLPPPGGVHPTHPASSALLHRRAAEGRRAAPAGWSSVSNRPSAPSLPPACSHTDAAPASGTQRLNTPAAETRDGGKEEFQVISETKREACTRKKGIVAGRRGEIVKKARFRGVPPT